MAAQAFPVTQQLRDDVETARKRASEGGQPATPEQREALRLVERDTMTKDDLARVAAALSTSADRLLTLTNSAHGVGTTGGPG